MARPGQDLTTLPQLRNNDMPRGKKQMPKEDPPAPTIDAPPQASPETGPQNSGSNCSDEFKRQSYREALILKIAAESAQETARGKLGSYRSYLKEAAKKGVPSDAITFALAKRFEDPDLIVVEQRERLKMLELSGFLPGIIDKIMTRMDIIEPTAKEEEESQVLIAYDRGHLAGRSGHKRDNNPYPPGSLGYVKWADGWRGGQDAIANEMGPAEDAAPEPPPPSPAPRRAQRRDDAMPGDMPAAVH